MPPREREEEGERESGERDRWSVRRFDRPALGGRMAAADALARDIGGGEGDGGMTPTGDPALPPGALGETGGIMSGKKRKGKERAFYN